MFYEEKLIDGFMMFRTSPHGEWKLMTHEMIDAKIATLEAENAELRYKMKSMFPEKDM